MIRRFAAAIGTFLLLVGLNLSAAAPSPSNGSFTDDDGNVHEQSIEAIAAEGITQGCNPPANDRYCPDVAVTREQMAAFLVRGLDLADTGDHDFFDDDDESLFETEIQKLAAAGIAKGCNPPENTLYCPLKRVTRGELAAFLVRAMGYADAGSGDLFNDDNDSVFEQDINRLGTAGVTQGCNPPNNDRYCPDDHVRRDEMASFLTRALDLAAAPPSGPPPVGSVLAVGDIAGESSCGETTAEIVRSFPGVPVLALGDLAYDDGTAEEFANCYARHWGEFDSRVYPVPGNHDYHTDDAGPYFEYLGSRAGESGRGWYSFDYAGWHFIGLNSELSMRDGSEQHDWLLEDLGNSSAQCTIAYWHSPRWNVGLHEPGSSRSDDVWVALDDAGVDIVLGGHDHNYQRWSQQNADGEGVEDGIRQFVVGTGGRGLYDQEIDDPELELFYNGSHGVLKLDLAPDSYDWEFIAVDGESFTDVGSDSCR